MNDYQFGNFIYELRTAKGLSQNELGEMLGVTNKAVSKWETGAARPNTKLLPKLAEILGVSVEELFVGHRIERPALTDAAAQEQKEESDRSPLRPLLDRLFRPWIIELIVFAAAAIVPYVVFAVSSGSEDKNTLLAAAPIACIFLFAFAFAIPFFLNRVSAIPKIIVDFFVLFFSVIFLAIGTMFLVRYIVGSIEYPPTVSALFAGLCAATVFSKIRKK